MYVFAVLVLLLTSKTAGQEKQDKSVSTQVLFQFLEGNLCGLGTDDIPQCISPKPVTGLSMAERTACASKYRHLVLNSRKSLKLSVDKYLLTLIIKNIAVPYKDAWTDGQMDGWILNIEAGSTECQHNIQASGTLNLQSAHRPLTNVT